MLWYRFKLEVDTLPCCEYFCQRRAKKDVLCLAYEKKSSNNTTVLFESNKGQALLLLSSRHESLRKVQAREISKLLKCHPFRREYERNADLTA